MRTTTAIIGIFLLVIPMAAGIGYSPTTLYGWIDGTDKFSITVNALDTETGESFPSVVKTNGNLYITTITRPDDGHQLEFQVHVNYRGNSDIFEIKADPWSLTNLNISISETASAKKSTDSVQGPIITDFLRESEDKDKFEKKYGTNILPAEKRLQEQTPSAIERRSTVSGESLLVILILFLSLLSITLMFRERHKKSAYTKKKNE